MTTSAVGSTTVRSLHRYPVKSLLGEQLSAADVTQRGLAGDRVGAFFDGRRVASAKQVRKWGDLLQLRATFDAGVSVLFPDGSAVAPPYLDIAVSQFLGRDVTYVTERADVMVIERTPVLPSDPTESEIGHAAPAGGFFDYAPVHIIASETLASLGDPDASRFRPNVVLEGPEPAPGVVLHLGDEVVVRVLVETPRCAVPPQRHGSLPPDPGLLGRLPRTPLGLCAGVYAEVITGGLMRVGDPVRPA